jgi:hypothetical protein
MIIYTYRLRIPSLSKAFFVSRAGGNGTTDRYQTSIKVGPTQRYIKFFAGNKI